MATSLPKISVIIPAYNAEATIARACRSVQNQEYPEVELVVVNDGSRDGTGRILEDLAREQGLVIVEQNNGGVSKARNTGLDRASGDYLMFLDADDELAPGVLAKMMDLALALNCDILAGTCIRVRPDGSSFLSDMPIDRDPSIWQGEEALCVSLKDHPSAYAVWGKLYRRDLIEQHQIRFPDIRKTGTYEDGLFNLEVMAHVKKAVFLDKSFYHYRRSLDGSLTTAYKADMPEKWKHGLRWHVPAR